MASNMATPERLYDAVVVGASGHYGCDVAARLLYQLLQERTGMNSPPVSLALVCRHASNNLLHQVMCQMADDQGQLPPEHAQRIQVSAQQLAPPLGPTGGSMDGTACAYIISMQPSTCIPEAKPGTAARAGAISGAKCAPIISAPTAHETSSLACCTAGSGGGSMLFRHVVQVPVCSVSSQSVTDARNDKAGEPVMKVAVLSGFEATDSHAVHRLAASTKLVVNCMRYTPAAYCHLLDACMEHSTHYVDINGDPTWALYILQQAAPQLADIGSSKGSETGQHAAGDSGSTLLPDHQIPSDYGSKQDVKVQGSTKMPTMHTALPGPIVMPGCGFDYLLPVLGALHAVRMLPPGATLCHMHGTLRVNLGPQGVILRYKTWEEAVQALRGSSTVALPKQTSPTTASISSAWSVWSIFKHARRGAAAAFRQCCGMFAMAARMQVLSVSLAWSVLYDSWAVMMIHGPWQVCIVLYHSMQAWAANMRTASKAWLKFHAPLRHDASMGCWVMHAPGTKLEEQLVHAALHRHMPHLLHPHAQPSATSTHTTTTVNQPSDAPVYSCCLAITSSLLFLTAAVLCVVTAAILARVSAITRQWVLQAGPWVAAQLMGVVITRDEEMAMQAMDAMSFTKRYELDFALPATTSADINPPSECLSEDTMKARLSSTKGHAVVTVESLPGSMRSVTASCVTAAAMQVMHSITHLCVAQPQHAATMTDALSFEAVDQGQARPSMHTYAAADAPAGPKQSNINMSRDAKRYASSEDASMQTSGSRPMYCMGPGEAFGGDAPAWRCIMETGLVQVAARLWLGHD